MDGDPPAGTAAEAPPAGTAAEGLITEAAMALDKNVKVEILRPSPGVGEEEDAVVIVKVTPPSDGTTRQPIDMVCVLDVSGSMGMEATIAGGESNGLTLLDVAKHGVKTVAHALGPNDRFSLVTFNNTARKIFELTAMDEAGHTKADAELENINPGGGTNIWAGLHEALETLKGRPKGRLAHIVLLTDGESTDREKIVPNLNQYREAHERLNGTINTFGFGYNLDSQLLVELAREGHGSYAFIPDAGMVGTAFVHSVSNLLATMAVETQLKLEPGATSKILERGPYGGYKGTAVDAENYLINIGTLQYGQSKDIVVPMLIKDDEYLFAAVSYETRCGVTCSPEGTQASASTPTADVAVAEQFCRSRYVDAIKRIQENFKANGVSESSISFGTEEVKAVLAVLENFAQAGRPSENVAKLKEDVTGQTAEALSRADWYQKWGRHYLASIANAHALQQCNNFKDPGVQVYGGSVFQDARDEADEIFNKLPPPKPRARPSYGGGAAAAPSSPVNMAAYNDRFAG